MTKEELEEELHNTRTQLTTAVEMGQALMVECQQMDALKQEVNRLEDAKDEWDQLREEFEWRCVPAGVAGRLRAV